MQRLKDEIKGEATGTLRARRVQDKPYTKDYKDFAVTISIDARRRIISAVNTLGAIMSQSRDEATPRIYASPSIKEIIEKEVRGFEEEVAYAILNLEPFSYRGEKYNYFLTDIDEHGTHFNPNQGEKAVNLET